MERRRPSLIGPLILITIGILLLLANLNMLPLSFWEIAVRYWPLILILIGLEVLIGRQSLLGGLVVLVLWIALIGGVLWLAFAQGSELLPIGVAATDQLTQPLGDIQSASIELDIGVSTAYVKPLESDAGDLIQGTFRHGEGMQLVKTYSVVGNEGRLALREAGSGWIFLNGSTSRLDFALNPQIPIALRVNSGVGRANLDLAGLNITSLDISTGIGTWTITTPKTGVTTMRIKGGIGSAAIAIPAGVAARIHVSGGIGAVHADSSRFPKSGAAYQSADYAGATNKIDIDVEGGIGSIDIR